MGVPNHSIHWEPLMSPKIKVIGWIAHITNQNTLIAIIIMIPKISPSKSPFAHLLRNRRDTAKSVKPRKDKIIFAFSMALSEAMWR